MTRCHFSHMCLHLTQGVIHIELPVCQITRLPDRIYPIRCSFNVCGTFTSYNKYRVCTTA